MSDCFSQQRIKAARVMVIGCGALGNEVLKNLVLMGIEHIVAVDFDIVEESNLTRSVLFRQADALARRKKADVVSERLAELNPSVQVTAICGDAAYDVGLGLIRRMDVVVACVDSRWARYCINRLCMRAGKPWVDGGIDGLEGTARVFRPGQNCYACSLGPEGLKALARRMPCSQTIRRMEAEGSAPTTSVVASVIGAVQVQEALKLLHPERLENGRLTSLCGKMFYYEGEHLSTRIVGFAAYDEECACHECWEPVIGSPLTAQSRVRDVLAWLRDKSGDRHVCLHLTNDCFVDEVVRRADDSRITVMRPGRQVAAFMDADEDLRGCRLGDFYQNEYREVDETFPYQDLTLAELGLPPMDVLHATSGQADYFVEMSEE